jgi:MFS family permease
MLISSRKVRPSLYMSCCMMAWATAATMTAVVHDFKGLVIVRFFLGVLEAPFYPGASMFIRLLRKNPYLYLHLHPYRM